MKLKELEELENAVPPEEYGLKELTNGDAKHTAEADES